MGNINAVIAVAGALVIVLATAGLMEIRSRAGPFDEPLLPAQIPVTTSGTYTATGPRGQPGPGNVCVPPTGQTQCSAARVRVDLTMSGLPQLGEGAQYHAFLLGPQPFSLGALTARGTQHTLRYEEERDGRAYGELVITLEKPDATTPGPLSVFVFDVAGKGQTVPASLASTTSTTIASGSGSVRAAEIGAFSKSTTAVGTLDGLPVLEGWAYHAWFLTVDGAYISLGAWDIDEKDPAHATLDGRVENIRLEDQNLFLTTLEPGDADAVSPGGVPAFVVDFSMTTKAMG